MDLRFTTPYASSLAKIRDLAEFLVMSKKTMFLINFMCIILAQPVLKSSSLIITNPDISSMKGESMFINIYSLGLRSMS